MYEIFAICEREGCNSRVQIPQPGALPAGWLVVGWQKTNVVLGNGPQQPQRQMVQSMFCSWKCALHFVKGFVTDKG